MSEEQSTTPEPGPVAESQPAPEPEISPAQAAFQQHHASELVSNEPAVAPTYSAIEISELLTQASQELLGQLAALETECTFVLASPAAPRAESEALVAASPLGVDLSAVLCAVRDASTQIHSLRSRLDVPRGAKQ